MEIKIYLFIPFKTIFSIFSGVFRTYANIYEGALGEGILTEFNEKKHEFRYVQA